MSKKSKIGIAIGATVIFLAVLIFSTVNRADISVVGTWYSDKPDSLTLEKDGSYHFSAWNGGNPWRTFSGTYTIQHADTANHVVLQNALDGTTILAITYDSQGNKVLSSKYNYYETEDAAKDAAANIVPNTVRKLQGGWTSLDGNTTCTFTETELIVHCLGNTAVPEKSIFHKYQILDDDHMKVTTEDSKSTFYYSIEEKNGILTLYCPGLEYAQTYTKDTTQSKEKRE